MDTPVKAIRKFCRQCTGNDVEAIRTCKPIEIPCPLHPFRMGFDPRLKKDLSDEQRKELSDRAKLNFKHGTVRQVDA